MLDGFSRWGFDNLLYILLNLGIDIDIVGKCGGDRTDYQEVQGVEFGMGIAQPNFYLVKVSYVILHNKLLRL